MNKTIELKPCPFCGSNDVEMIRPPHGGSQFVYCFGCDSSSGQKNAAVAAAELWNTRVEADNA